MARTGAGDKTLISGTGLVSGKIPRTLFFLKIQREQSVLSEKLPEFEWSTRAACGRRPAKPLKIKPKIAWLAR
jgi:hypothetical protein